MTDKQFIVVVGTILLMLFIFMGVERYRDCQQFGGEYCKLAPLGQLY